jgi:hypothetical protein
MSGNGARMIGMRITMMRPLMAVLGLIVMKGKISIMKMSHIQAKMSKKSLILCCGAVPGSIVQITAVPLPATTTIGATTATTTLSVFG